MSVAVNEQEVDRGPRASRPALIVTGAAALCLVGTGLLLWSQHGAVVFSETVLAALAWCF